MLRSAASERFLRASGLASKNAFNFSDRLALAAHHSGLLPFANLFKISFGHSSLALRMDAFSTSKASSPRC